MFQRINITWKPGHRNRHWSIDDAENRRRGEAVDGCTFVSSRLPRCTGSVFSSRTIKRISSTNPDMSEPSFLLARFWHLLRRKNLILRFIIENRTLRQDTCGEKKIRLRLSRSTTLWEKRFHWQRYANKHAHDTYSKRFLSYPWNDIDLQSSLCFLLFLSTATPCHSCCPSNYTRHWWCPILAHTCVCVQWLDVSLFCSSSSVEKFLRCACLF